MEIEGLERFRAVLVLAAALPMSALQAQTSKPSVSLTISADPATFKSGQMEQLTVTEKNLTGHPINASRSIDQWTWYKVDILRDGMPVHETKDLLKRKSISRDERLPSSTFYLKIKRHQQIRLGFPIATFYDMSVPGTYKITLAADGEVGEKVRSNTLTINVLPPN